MNLNKEHPIYTWGIAEDRNVLIVCHQTGIFYSSQTGGISCNHPLCEGFLVLLASDLDYNDCPLGCWGGGDQTMRLQLANELDEHFKKVDAHYQGYPSFMRSTAYNFRINRDKLDELEEGWWPVYFEIFGQTKTGFIHCGNCD